MSIGLTTDYIYSQLKSSSNENKTSTLKNKLSEIENGESTDEEMLEVCKEFEAYLLEKVMKQMKETMTDSEEEENDYLSYFGDMMYQEYAKQITENGELGLAQQLYESMKRNTVSGIRDAAQTAETVSVVQPTEE